jgi:protein-S-isoprenylcysteine O-methyltransferase Ste14
MSYVHTIAVFGFCGILGMIYSLFLWNFNLFLLYLLLVTIAIVLNWWEFGRKGTSWYKVEADKFSTARKRK